MQTLSENFNFLATLPDQIFYEIYQFQNQNKILLNALIENLVENKKNLNIFTKFSMIANCENLADLKIENLAKIFEVFEQNVDKFISQSEFEKFWPSQTEADKVTSALNLALKTWSEQNKLLMLSRSFLPEFYRNIFVKNLNLGKISKNKANLEKFENVMQGTDSQVTRFKVDFELELAQRIRSSVTRKTLCHENNSQAQNLPFYPNFDQQRRL